MFKTLPSATAKITELEQSVSSKDAEIITLNQKLVDAAASETKLAEVEAKLVTATAEITALTTRAELAEKSVVEAKGEHETIEARIEAEATLKAVDQVAAAGGAPIVLEKSGNSGGATSEVTAANFWEQHRNQTPSNKSGFYNKHKHVIGR